MLRDILGFIRILLKLTYITLFFYEKNKIRLELRYSEEEPTVGRTDTLHSVFQNPLVKKFESLHVFANDKFTDEYVNKFLDIAFKVNKHLKEVNYIIRSIHPSKIKSISEQCKLYGKKFVVYFFLNDLGHSKMQIPELLQIRIGNAKNINLTNEEIILVISVERSIISELEYILYYLSKNKVRAIFSLSDEILKSPHTLTADEKYCILLFFNKLVGFSAIYTKEHIYYNKVLRFLSEQETINQNGVLINSNGNIDLGSSFSVSNNSTGQFCFINATPSRAELLAKVWENLWKKIFQNNNEYIKWVIHFLVKLIPIKRNEKKRVFITGWYGTETLGDKAILGHIFDYYNNEFNNKVEFLVSSIHPFITERTLLELGVQGTVIPVYSVNFFKTAAIADVSVMGGGPLMDIDEIYLPLWAFRIAKLNNKKTIIFGCGIGPLRHKTNLVKQLFNYSDIVMVRDNASGQYASKISPRLCPITYGDGAKYYVQKLNNSIPKGQKENILALFLREWPKNFKSDMTDEEFYITKYKFETNLAYLIKAIEKKYLLKAYCYPMHVFAVGCDDRDFFRKFSDAYFNGELQFFDGINSITGAIELMNKAALSITMRFHSVLFANTLGVPFSPIDYTNGGKIAGFLKDENYNEKLHTVMELSRLDNQGLLDLVDHIKF